MNKILVSVLKIAFSAVLLGLLGYKAWRDDSFNSLLHHDKNWTLLVVAWFAGVSTLLIQIFRWRLLATALHLKLPPGEAIRLGFLSNLFSLVGVGMLGGDALKIYFLGQRNRGHVPEALTSVFVDRVIGLYGLVLLAGAITFFFDPLALSGGASSNEAKGVAVLCQAARWGALGSTIGLIVFFLPGVATWKGWDAVERLPKIGGILAKLLAAVRLYRHHSGRLAAAVVMSLAIHVLNSMTILLISHSLPAIARVDDVEVAVDKPSVAAHVTAASLALATGALPLGALEVVFNTIYRGVSSSQMPHEQGFLIILAYRVLQLGTATIGLYFYLRGRREVDEAMHHAEEDLNAATPPAEPLTASSSFALLRPLSAD